MSLFEKTLKVEKGESVWAEEGRKEQFSTISYMKLMSWVGVSVDKINWDSSVFKI